MKHPSSIEIRDPADRFDLSYVFANDHPALGKKPSALEEMAEVAREIVPGVHCRGALVHPGEINELAGFVRGSSVMAEVVVDFPDGVGGVVTKREQSRVAREAGAAGGDVVLNLHLVRARNKAALLEELRAAKEYLHEMKVIAQIHYLWQYERDSIPWLLDIVNEAGAYCIKDWTTRVDNFLLPEGDILDYKDATRFAYLEFIAKYIAAHSLPLVLKVAGKVTADNVKSFINTGALLIGTSYRKAPVLREALLK